MAYTIAIRECHNLYLDLMDFWNEKFPNTTENRRRNVQSVLCNGRDSILDESGYKHRRELETTELCNCSTVELHRQKENNTELSLQHKSIIHRIDCWRQTKLSILCGSQIHTTRHLIHVLKYGFLWHTPSTRAFFARSRLHSRLSTAVQTSACDCLKDSQSRQMPCTTRVHKLNKNVLDFPQRLPTMAVLFTSALKKKLQTSVLFGTVSSVTR